jgi:hypothetical protein
MTAQRLAYPSANLQFLLHFAHQREVAHLIRRLLFLGQHFPLVIGDLAVAAERVNYEIL